MTAAATHTTPDVVSEMRRDRPLGFLLCRPTHFSVEYEINPFMDLGVPADPTRAMRQWEAFAQHLRDAGAEVVVQEGGAGLPDHVFTNNAGLVVGDRALLTRFRHAQRTGEEAYNRATFAQLGYEVVELPDDVHSFEGAADAVSFGGHVICGYGPRTDRAADPFIADLFGQPLLEVPLIDERFYHLDLAFCALDEQTAMVSEVATTPEALEQLLALIPNAIVLDESETLAFCANAAVVGTTVFMHAAPARVRERLAAFGFDAIEVPADEFLKAGGSLGCMSLRLY
jgi:N-dimethylarginine dimethylaminohydrolase